ncbi:hypothetical protein PFICI_13469 [Pestalotiopsis fici W106-1]|uniref:2-(3-amino-3-carboxypropyl)histidine synthase subunit 2 n=1 Tax=Pestalotiopsis fici (strain W106-1 / CGMCC3.15140) TaxID=1229662 RepID=W3WM33_PESFW|nr:uncharacterized protein PFICI_13469 [Pestalotiopsis fici W106-1]ETS74985.1 hypothetical protein PFICI_13469 [Pestalotiopsis fici W106-1]
MASDLTSAPVLSTPAEHTFSDDPTPNAVLDAARSKRSDDELRRVYEIERTVSEIAQKGWRRVALQFPDAMLRDAGWVVEALSQELRRVPLSPPSAEIKNGSSDLETDMNASNTATNGETAEIAQPNGQDAEKSIPRLYVLADTSYSSCCVDEIAAEHADAEAVVHYGRACLSPTARLPVLHIFTKQELDYDAVCDAFEKEFDNKKDEKVVIMADVMFQDHVKPICAKLTDKGWTNVKATEIVRDPSATIPNRKLVESEDNSSDSASTITDLKDHHMFHISTPPTALLLTLSSRLSSLRIYDTPVSPYTTATDSKPDPSITANMLSRRYGLVIRLATASIFGILVNTLSVANYLPTITKLKEQIAAAGKKSYTIVVGKLNAAKLANFAEVDGWVVVGCWESGLVEQDGMWKPVLTPFELELALAGDDKRIWDGSWWGGIEGVGKDSEEDVEDENNEETEESNTFAQDVDGGVDDEESEPPEFDLRTGKLISNSRPMRMAIRSQQAAKNDSASTQTSATKAKDPSNALVQHKFGELAMVNGVVSPGAQYLRSQRTWQGLGSDFRDVDDDEKEYEDSTLVQEGRSGVARGYTVGEDSERN